MNVFTFYCFECQRGQFCYSFLSSELLLTHPLTLGFSYFVPKALTIQESEMFGASFPDASFVKTLHSSSKPLLFSVALHMTQHKYLSTDQQTNHVVDTIHTN